MTDLVALATTLLRNGPHKSSPTPRRVRVLFNKTYIADTLSAQHVWEHPYYPTFYLPHSSILASALRTGRAIPNPPPSSPSSSDDDSSEPAAFLGTLRIGQRTTDRVLMFEKGPLAGLVRLEFGAMDAWFEEESEVYVHPKDPFKRIETLPSRRAVGVEVEGKVVAESGGMVVLLETGLPARYYLPKTAVSAVAWGGVEVRWEFLSPSETTSSCPYKGMANYYHVTVGGKKHEDAVWWYKYPTPESIAIAGMVCFYNEKVDIWIDGVKQERPKSKFG